MSLLKWPPGGHTGFFVFRLWILTPKVSSTTLVYMGRYGRLVVILDFYFLESVGGKVSWAQLCFRISISNFMCMLFLAVGRRMIIFSDVTFKTAAWRPYLIIQNPDLSLFWLWIWNPKLSNTSLVCMGITQMIFSNVTLKMAALGPYSFFLASGL